MSKPRVLIIDDEISICKTLKAILEDEKFEVEFETQGQNAHKAIREFKPQVVLLDVWLKNHDGIEILKNIRSKYSVPVIMLSGHATIDLAIEATRIGAIDFIEKPLSIDRLLLSLEKIPKPTSLSLIGETQSIVEIKNLIDKLSLTKSNVLITGEAGTGKEVVARLIHEQSSRSGNDFVDINCAAIPDELIESELFGFEKGSFTGANKDRKGRFELAHLGTLFMDEVGDLSLKAQAKVLRVLQERKFERIGSEKKIEVDVRVLSATNKNLPIAIENGDFREDLFYRLNVVPLHLPPLRDRKNDIPLLIDHFLNLFALEQNIPVPKIEPDHLLFLKNQNWPGNIRELKNFVERWMTLSVPELEHPKLFLSQKTHELKFETSQDFKEAKINFEKQFITEILIKNQFNISKSALELGMERTYLHKKLKQLQIKVDD